MYVSTQSIRLHPFTDWLANFAGLLEVIERARSPPGPNGASPADMLRFIISERTHLKSPIAYFGGKSRLAPKFIELFPDHKRYVEVFGGGGSVLFAKPLSEIEIYNDLDEALFEFFWVVSQPTLFGRLKRIVGTMPFSRRLMLHCYDRWTKEKSMVTRVAMWYVCQRQGFGGRFSTSWGYSVESGRNGLSQCVAKWLNGIERLGEAHTRLQTVQLDNRDFRKVILAYDRPDTFFYMDPPYVPSTRRSGGYRFEMTAEDHQDLVTSLLELKGKALLSGYDSELYRPLEAKGWQRREYKTVCDAAGHVRGSGLQGKGACKEKQQRIEVIWANYPLPA